MVANTILTGECAESMLEKGMKESHRVSQASTAATETNEEEYGDRERFNYEAPQRKPYPCVIAHIRKWLFWSFIVLVFAVSMLWIAIAVLQEGANAGGGHCERIVYLSKLISVPLVSLLFTWFHVWLALQMMFYPIDFYGIPGRPIVPQWLDLPINGWQGIVPRKAAVMAQRCCDKMIGNICTIEEFAERVDPVEFWESLQDVFGQVCSRVLQRIIENRFPSLWAVLPQAVQMELKIKVYEETRKSLLPCIEELKKNINSILDIKQMATEALTKEPRMMVDMFRTVAARELSFITHVAAVMGFVLGLVQVILYVVLEPLDLWWADFVMLPVSGLIIGYFTNWLALKMTFSPIMPHMMCGGYVNFQGVFLKRQAEAADQMAKAICEKVIDARAMMDYMMRSTGNSSDGVEQILAIYNKHISNAVDQSVGRLAGVCPASIKREINSLKQDVVDYSLELLPQHTTQIERYMDEKMKVRQILSWRLARVTPEEFEDIIHPIFKADEWILLAVGGLLGVVIGLLQAWALMAITCN